MARGFQARYHEVMIRLFLVRHGETDWNRDGRYQGQTDVPLNAEGRRQAALLRDRLRDERFTGCFTSALGRAVESAEIVLAARACPIRPTAGLNELHYGEWEGLTTAEIKARFADSWAAFIADPVRNAPPGGETRLQLRDRVVGVLDAIAAEYRGRDASLLVAAHGGTIRALVATILNISLDDLWKLRQDNAALTIVDLYSTGGELALFDDTAHLGPSKSSRPDRPPVH
jgi:alpha-ribazole phosphatase